MNEAPTPETPSIVPIVFPRVAAAIKALAEFLDSLKHTPAWLILSVLFVALMVLYHVRADHITEQLVTGFGSALLLSINSNRATSTTTTETTSKPPGVNSTTTTSP